MNDRYGLPLSTATEQAAHAYLWAADRLLAAGAGLIEGFDSALALDPGFALAEIGRARCLATYGRAAEARDSAARARALVSGATRRERGHVEALALSVEGRGAESLAAIRAHLAEFPRDALVLHPAVGIFGLIGFSGRLDREAELLAMLDDLAPHYGDDWWFASAHAFAECEAGRLAEAERRVERALAAAPHNANAAHVRAHVFYELGQAPQAAEFLRAWLHEYSPLGLLRGHLSWHLALVEFGLGNAGAAWALYEREIRAPLDGAGSPTPPLNVLTDGVSWLWRAQLRGEAARECDWRALAAFASERFPRAGVVFGDVHAALAHACVRDSSAIERLCNELAQLSAERPACGTAQRFAAAFAAYAVNDWGRAADLFGEEHEACVRVGGSKAQRELIDRSLLSALRQAGRDEQLKALLARRPHLAAGV